MRKSVGVVAMLMLGLPANVPAQDVTGRSPKTVSAEDVPADPATAMLFFDWNSAKISAESSSILDKAIAANQQGLAGRVAVRAFSDRSGSRASSLAMALRRADAVREYLVSHGVTGKISVRAVGDRHPLIRTADGVREAQNRRVEISFEG